MTASVKPFALTMETYSLQRLERARLCVTRTVARAVMALGVVFGVLSVYSREPPGILACIAAMVGVSLVCHQVLTPARRHACDRTLAIVVAATVTAVTHVYPNVATLTLFVPLAVVILCTEVSGAWRTVMLSLIFARFAYVLYLASVGEATVADGPAYNYMTTVHCVIVGLLSTFLTTLFHELGHRVRTISQGYADRLAEQVAQSRAVTEEMAAGSAAFAKTNNDIQTSVLQQRRLQAELAATHEQLEHFANAASHDLKEPIRTIRSFSQLLRRELTSASTTATQKPVSDPAAPRTSIPAANTAPAASKQIPEAATLAVQSEQLTQNVPPAAHAAVIADLTFVENSCEDMHRLLEKLLLYQRTTSANADDFVIQSIPVAKLWREALRHEGESLLSSRELQRGHHLRVERAVTAAIEQSLLEDRTSGLAVAACPERTRALFAELVRNALTYHDGTREMHLACTAELGDDGFVHIAVADNGIGIAGEYRDRVFGMFQRLHARETYPGAGLGLPIARRIVEGGGGRISLDSAVGVGTTVHVVLPEG